METTPLDSGVVSRLPRFADEQSFLASLEARGAEEPESFGMLQGADGAYRLLRDPCSHEIYLARWPRGQVIVLAVVEDRSRAREMIAAELEELIGPGRRGAPPATPVDSWLDSVPGWSFLGIGLDPRPARGREYSSPRDILYGKAGR